MTDLSLVENIWDRPAPGLSKQLKSAIYVARAKAIVSQILETGSGHAACVAGRICRVQFATLIGCSYATVSQNKQISSLIQAADKRLQHAVLTPAASRLQKELRNMRPPEGPSVSLPEHSFFSQIVLARADDKDAKAIPTIVLANGIHEASSDWLRNFIGEGGGESSALQYAKMLRAFLLYCRRQRIDWKSVDDQELIRWRDFKLNRGVLRKTINDVLAAVFRFYVFCELNGLLRYRVGCYERAELPERLRQMRFPISAERVFTGDRNQVAGWATPLLYRTTESSIGNRQTPDDDQMTGLHEHAVDGKTGDRNDLILSWIEDSAGRRAEILQVKVNHIPGRHTIDALCDDPHPWLPIDIPHRKGGTAGTLVVSADTLLMTRSYMEKERKAIVARAKAANPAYQEPLQLFLSSTTGRPLKPDSVTALFKPMFRRVGLDAANVHRVRAKASVDYVESLLDRMLDAGIEVAPGSAWIETILQQASLKLGHRSLDSLRHYLTTALWRRIRTAESAVDRVKARSTRNASVLLSTALSRLGVARRLLDDVRTLSRSSAVAAALRSAANEFDVVEEEEEE